MTNETLEPKPIDKPAEASPPKPRKSWRGAILMIVALLMLVVAVPVAVAVAAVAYLLLGTSPARPPSHAQRAAIPVAQNRTDDAPHESLAPPRKDVHPLDGALEIAYGGLDHMQKNVDDYTATLLSRERIGGELKEEQTMSVKIRSPKKDGEGKVTRPLSVYLKFVEPKSKAGREVIYVAGQNNDKIVGHETGFLNVTRYFLRPEGPVAMLGERYPITEIGVQRLTEQLIERGEEERLLDPRETKVEVTVEKGVEFIERQCTRIKVRYPEKTAQVEFHSAEILIDEELTVPIYYVAYSWPTEPGGEPLLEEEYTYKDLKLNVGLTDADFDPNNKEYKFP